MRKIFISYSRIDETFARQLAVALANLGADIWIDIEDIPAGMKWSSAIQDGLDNADALIVIISPESMASRNVEDEWQYFLDHDKPVIPLLLRQAKIHFQLNRIQWVDFMSQPYDLALTQLHAELVRNGVRIQAPPRPAAVIQQPAAHIHPTPPAQKPKMTQSQSGDTKQLALIGGGVAILVVLGIAGFFVASALNNPVVSPTPRNVATDVGMVVTQPVVASASSTPDLPPTNAPTFTPSPIPPILGPVANNDDWQPIERTIDGVVMVLVPRGRFTQGTNQTHYDANFAACTQEFNANTCRGLLDDEFTGGSVEVSDPYWIDKYEVSQRLFDDGLSLLPMVNITSGRAQRYCESRGGSLPSEAEWEYAAKGPDGWRYPWGNTWDLNEQRANICDVNCASGWRESRYNDGNSELAVITTLANEGRSWVGAANMAGNVWEWTSDVYAPGETNTLRGGGWTWIQGEATTTSRAAGIATESSFYGFRCVRPYAEGDLERYRYAPDGTQSNP